MTAMADHADVDVDQCKSRAVERVEHSIEAALHSTVNGYGNITVRNKHIRSLEGKATPVLMPVWLITTEKKKTGKEGFYFCHQRTDRPPDLRRAAGWEENLCMERSVFAGVFAVGYAILVILSAMGVIS